MMVGVPTTCRILIGICLTGGEWSYFSRILTVRVPGISFIN